MGIAYAARMRRSEGRGDVRQKFDKGHYIGTGLGAELGAISNDASVAREIA